MVIKPSLYAYAISHTPYANMNRLGILGGTFDPIHLGHLRMAQVALGKMKLDKVIFVPANIPPHKNPRGLSPSDVRLKMVELAVRTNPHFEVSPFEVEKKGKSYSIDTVGHFAKAFPGVQIFFIIGYDALVGLHQWKAIDEILKIVEFIVVNRPGNFTNLHHIKHSSVRMPGMDISSSHIRQLVKQGKSIRALVPEAVREYIERNKLYQ